MANGWTEERRQKQSQLIRQWQPWSQSTGPRTAEGKARASANSYKGGHWKTLRELSRALREQSQSINNLS